MALYQLDERVPVLDADAYVHENATVIGSVRLASGASVWPYATLRGDNEPIVVGEGSNVQEGCTLHTDPGWPLTLGKGVTVGHQATLHGCTIGDGSLVGIQAVVLNGARIGRDCLIGAGALVTEGMVIPDDSLVLGAPARVVRTLAEADRAAMQANAQKYAERSRHYRTALKRIA
jgi:carbonic anhydrase/acetyltransferase-like protein (isoleucine patch superfamily)